MPQSQAKYPNYARMSESPDQDGPGLTICLAPPPEGDVYALGKPIILHGKYGVDRARNERAGGAPLTRIVIRAGKPDQTDAPGRPVKDGHTQPPRTPDDDGGGYLLYGHFNLDLQQFAKNIREPGEYWVQAELFDLKSEKVEFTVE